MSIESEKPKLKYILPSEKNIRSFASHVFDELDDGENIKTQYEKIAGFSDFLLAVATIIAKSKSDV